jgi:hypothetical protein
METRNLMDTPRCTATSKQSGQRCPPDPGTLDAGDDAVSVPLVATTARELAARALLAGPDGSPHRVSALLDVSRPTIDRMTDADLSTPSRDPQLLEGARTYLAETASRGSTVEEREGAVAWLQAAARDERQQFAAARRKVAAVSPHVPSDTP